MKKVTIFILLVLANLQCDRIDKALLTADQIANLAAQTIDDAINKLSVESANFQQILDETLKSLPDQVSDRIRGDISNTFQRGISAASLEFRCDVDFLRNRLRQSLERLKAKILESPMPDIEPQICNVVPAAIDMGLKPNMLEFFGYDFDLSDVKVLLFDGTTQKDVTKFLSKTTHYHMVLNLGGNGLTLRATSSRLVLRSKGVDISTIQIIQEVPDICETIISRLEEGKIITFIPPHTGGDLEFGGNGPKVSCTVTLINRRSKVDALITMQAIETKTTDPKKKTIARGNKIFTIFTPNPGYEVKNIIGPTSCSFTYTDNDLNEDIFFGEAPVAKFIFIGDGPGNDAGINTQVRVVLDNLKFELKENRNCIDGNTIRTMVNQNALSTAKVRRIRSMSPSVLQNSPAGQ